MADSRFDGGTLRGQTVRFCSVCCRFNPLPGPLCAVCRTRQGHALVRPAFSYPFRRRLRFLTRIVGALTAAAVVAGSLVSDLPMALVAIGFYVVLAAMALVMLRSWVPRPCDECRARRMVARRPQFAAPGVPLLATPGPGERVCRSCGTAASESD